MFSLRICLKRIYLNALMTILFLTANVFAQDNVGSFRERVDRDIFQDRIIETDNDSYVREREIILRQLEIITGDEETRYIIVSGDTLSINFKDRDQMNEGVYQVSSSGEIYLPLVGPLEVGGLNRQQTRTKINTALKEYIRYPQAEVMVNISGRYMVAGEVLEPGVFRVRPNLTIMEAILGADYDKNTARLNSIILVRGNFDDPVVTRLDLLKMIRKGDMTDNLTIKPGDFIYVPKTWIGNIEKFIDNVYRYVTAYYGLGRIPGEPVKSGEEADKVFFE